MLLAGESPNIDKRREGYVLLAVLIVIVVLSLAAYRYSDMMSAEYRASDRILRNAEAKALADSGIHYTISLLADKTAFTSTPINGNPYDNREAFFDKTLNNGRTGRFSVTCVDYAQDTGTGDVPLKYGVVDEAAKININALLQLDPSGQILLNVLKKLPGMTDEIANSIKDWIDTDEEVSSGGAEMNEYTGRTPSYRCKNGPLDSVEELLLVKGVTPELLFGSDLNRNGRRDPDEAGGEFSYGWAPYLTVYSREKNVDSEGTARIKVNGRTLKPIYDQMVPLIGQNLAAYLIAYRAYDLPSASSGGNNNTKQQPPKEGQIADLVKKVESDLNGKQAPRAKRSISSLLQLLGTSVQVAGQNNEPATIYAFPATDSVRDVLPIVLDKLTTVSDTDLPGRINVNTAPREVLSTLPGLDTADVDAIFAKRPSGSSADGIDPIYQTPAWLYTEANIAVSKLQALERYVTARTQVYRIQSVGYFQNGGPVVRVEAVVDVNDGKPRILYYRDLTELGRSIDPRAN